MRHAQDADLLQLDTAPRLQRFALVAAPAAALLGVVAVMLAQWGMDAAAALPLSRPQLAGAVGRFVADAAGILVIAPVLLCWLARPQGAWRERRRLVALPLLAVVVLLLPGVDQVARRDETRLQVRFDREASLRQLRVQKLLADPLNAVLALRGVLAVASTLSYAGYLLYSGEVVRRIGSLRLTGWASSVACVLCLAQFALLRPVGGLADLAPPVVWLSLINGTLCTVLPVLLVMMAIERIGPALTAQTGMIGPMSTILMGVVILGEPLNSWIIAGTVLVITGIYVFSRSARQA